MAQDGKTTAEGNEKGNAGETTPPKSLEIAAKGIRTSSDFSNLMSALMSDLIEGKVTPNVGNAACNAGGKLLKMVDMTYRYGSKSGGAIPKKTLSIAFEELPKEQEAEEAKGEAQGKEAPQEE